MSHPLNPLDFPLHGTRLIEASAGTGKTFTIALLYVRLVLQHGGNAAFDRPLQPPDILVVTFTNAATEELRDRIRKRLTQAARVFRGDEAGDAPLQALMADFTEAERPARARLLDLAASAMDEAAVHTIHGWSQRMLRQHAFDSGNPFRAELDTDDSELLLEAARDYWRTYCYALDPETLAQVQALVADPDALAQSLRPFLDGTDEPGATGFLDTLAAWSRTLADLSQTAADSWQTDAGPLGQWFEDALTNKRLNGNRYRPDSTRSALAEIETWAAQAGPAPLKALERFGTSRLKLNKGAPAPDFAALQAVDRLLDHAEAKPDIEEALLRHAAAWCRHRLERQKAKLNRMGFDDLLVRLDAALQGESGPRLARTIRQQFPIALIDEFQDTDPLQYRIFQTVYLNQPGTGLFMIGDPKQAIYAFRGADIYTYLQARGDAAGNLFTLPRNFRSSKGLVDAVNRLFGLAGDYPQGSFLLGDRIPFQPVDAQGRKDQLLIGRQKPTPLQFWLPQGQEAWSTTDYRNLMTDATASQIVHLLDGNTGFVDEEGLRRPLQASDIAILVRGWREAQQIQYALAERGLRSVFLSERSSVYATPEAQDLLLWLEAVAEPGHEQRLRLALSSATLDLPFSELDTAQQDDDAWEARVEDFRELHQLWRGQGVLPLVRRLLDRFDVAARLLGEDGGERRLTNLLQLAELLHQAETQLDGELALIRYLDEQIRDAGRGGQDEHILRLESDESLIKIVTIHKSKGLEYPLVFLPFIAAARPVSKKDSPIRYHDDSGEPVTLIRADDAALERADRERLAEDLRLLYVALTRASHACWVGVAPLGRHNKSGYRCELRDSAIGYLLGGGTPLLPDELQQRLGTLTSAPNIAVVPPPEPDLASVAPATPAITLAPARTPQHFRAQSWWIGSYTGLLTGAAMPDDGLAAAIDRGDFAEDSPEEANLRELGTQPEAQTGEADPETLHAFPRGSQPGTFLHDILEWSAGQGFERVANDTALRNEHLLRACTPRGWENWVPVLDRWLAGFLTTPLALPCDRGACALAELSLMQAELEFWFAANTVDSARLDRLVTQSLLPGQRRPALAPRQLNGMLKGFIDLVFEHQGRYFVVDYKSNALGDSNNAYTPAAMNEAMLGHRYELQYSLYILALHRQLRARLPDYDYDRHIGGALYLFLRGVDGEGRGVYRDRPPRTLIDAMDALFRGDSGEGAR
ncbi:exodeoxyribonuclease V subunit beta [Mangrovitalea sediminis]|uniref:exodeoxyribonuclease V subunit beta n=1 Tax=Mangrovitalea sediminis TaxID=1982043 RepID=UPI000BE50180|nr:exodeoxyribonuclease V subunit beta [Mangrovitalea sediminis]